MKRRFTKYPNNYVKASEDYLSNPVIVVLDRYSKKTQKCDDITQAQLAVSNYIDRNGLGAGCSPYSRAYNGGEVFDADTGEYLGHISYNGRFWSVGDKWDAEHHGLIRDYSYFTD